MRLTASNTAWAFELAIWLIVAAVFLLFYTAEPQVPAAAAAPHLGVMALGWLMLTIVRMVAAMLIADRTVLRWVVTAIAAALLTVIAAYDALVIAGLRLWGRVVTWELIATYAKRLPAFADAFGMPIAAGALVAAALYATAAAAIGLYLKRCDWVAELARRVDGRRYVKIVAGCALLCTFGVYAFRTGVATRFAEPLSLTLYPELAADDLQHVTIDRLRAERLDAEADEARAGYAASPAAARKNVIVFVVDALRADHMGLYGYSRDTTPNLSRLKGTHAVRIVPEVRSSCSSTACGVTSLLGSQFAHGFSHRPFTLPEVLKRHGYRTHVAIGDDHTTFYGLTRIYRGADTYHDTATQGRRYSADDAIPFERMAALSPWDGVPVMLYYHLMSVHSMGRRDARHAKYLPASNYALAPTRNAGEAVNHYDNGVVQADALIQQMLDALGAKGYLRDTVVVVTADHGEALGEDGRYSHARGLSEEMLRIPLVFIAYGHAPQQLAAADAIASQADVAPTILRELGMPPPRTWAGSALQDAQARGFIYLREGDHIGFIDQRDRRNVWKYWVERGSGREHVVNLSSGSGEREEPVETIAADLRADWRRRYLHLAVGAAPRDGGKP